MDQSTLNDNVGSLQEEELFTTEIEEHCDGLSFYSNTSWRDFSPSVEYNYESDPFDQNDFSFEDMSGGKEEQINLLTEELKDKEQVIQTLNQLVIDHKEQLKVLQHHIEDRDEKIQSLENECEIALANVRDYQDELESRTAELNLVRENLKDEKQQNEHYEELVNNLEEQSDEQRAEWKGKITKLEEELAFYKTLSEGKKEQQGKDDSGIEGNEEVDDTSLQLTSVVEDFESKVDGCDVATAQEKEELMQRLMEAICRNEELRQEIVELKENHDIVLSDKTITLRNLQFKWEEMFAENEQLRMEVNKLRCRLEEQESRSHFLDSREKDTESDQRNAEIMIKLSLLQSEVDKHISRSLSLARENTKLNNLLLSEQEQNGELNRKLAKVSALYDETYVKLIENESEKVRLKKLAFLEEDSCPSHVDQCRCTKSTYCIKQYPSLKETVDCDNNLVVNQECDKVSSSEQQNEKCCDEEIEVRDNWDCILDKTSKVYYSHENKKSFDVTSSVQRLLFQVIDLSIFAAKDIYSFVFGENIAKDHVSEVSYASKRFIDRRENVGDKFIPGVFELMTLAVLVVVAFLCILTDIGEGFWLGLLLPISMVIYGIYLIHNTPHVEAVRSKHKRSISKDINVNKSKQMEQKDAKESESCLRCTEAIHLGKMNQHRAETHYSSNAPRIQSTLRFDASDKLETETKAVCELKQKSASPQNATENILDAPDKQRNIYLQIYRHTGPFMSLFFLFFAGFPLAVMTSLYLNVFIQFWIGWGLIIYYVTLISLFAVVIREKIENSFTLKRNITLSHAKATAEEEAKMYAFEIEEMAMLLDKEQDTVLKQRQAINALERQLLIEAKKKMEYMKFKGILQDEERKNLLDENAFVTEQNFEQIITLEPQNAMAVSKTSNPAESGCIRKYVTDKEDRASYFGRSYRKLLVLSAIAIPVLPVVIAAYYMEISFPILFALAVISTSPGVILSLRNNSCFLEGLRHLIETKTTSPKTKITSKQFKIIMMLSCLCFGVICAIILVAVAKSDTLARDLPLNMILGLVAVVLLIVTDKLLRERQMVDSLQKNIVVLDQTLEKERDATKLLKEETRALIYRLEAQKAFVERLQERKGTTMSTLNGFQERGFLSTKIEILQREFDKICREKDDLSRENMKLYEEARRANEAIQSLEENVVADSDKNDRSSSGTNECMTEENKEENKVMMENVISSSTSKDTNEKADETLDTVDASTNSEEKIISMGNSISELTNKIQKLASANKKLFSQLSEESEKSKTKSVEIEILTAELLKHKDEIEGWKLQQEMVQQALEAYKMKELKCKMTEEENDKLLSEIAVTNAMRSALESDLHAERDRVKELGENMLKLQGEIQKFNSLSHELDLFRDQNKALKNEIESLVKERRIVQENLWAEEMKTEHLKLVQQEKLELEVEIEKLRVEYKNSETTMLEELKKYRYKFASTSNSESLDLLGDTNNVDEEFDFSNLIVDYPGNVYVNLDKTLHEENQPTKSVSCGDTKTGSPEENFKVVEEKMVHVTEEIRIDLKKEIKESYVETLADELAKAVEQSLEEETEHDEVEEDEEGMTNIFSTTKLNEPTSEEGESDYADPKDLEIMQLSKMLDDLSETEAKLRVLLTQNPPDDDSELDESYSKDVHCSKQSSSLDDHIILLTQEVKTLCNHFGLDFEQLENDHKSLLASLARHVNKVRENTNNVRENNNQRLNALNEVTELRNKVVELEEQLTNEKATRDKMIAEFESEYKGLEIQLSCEYNKLKQILENERITRRDIVTDYEREFERIRQEYELEKKNMEVQLKNEGQRKEEALRRGQRLYRQIHTLESELENLRKQKHEDFDRQCFEIQEIIHDEDILQRDDIKELLENKFKEYNKLRIDFEEGFAVKDKINQDKMANLESMIEELKLLIQQKDEDILGFEQTKKYFTDRTNLLQQRLKELEEEVRLGDEIENDISTGSVRDLDTIEDPGIIETLAYNSDKSKWQNPTMNSDVSVLRSSPGFGHPSDLLEQKPSICSTEDHEHSWFQIDFGSGLAVLPRAYALRHGWVSDDACLRSWILEGSPDGIKWIVVRKHVLDTSLNARYQKVSWSLSGVYKPFRFLRVRQTGRNSSGTNELFLSGFEVYGKLIRTC